MVAIDLMVAEACCVQWMAIGNPGCAFWVRAQAALVRQCVLPVRGWSGDSVL